MYRVYNRYVRALETHGLKLRCLDVQRNHNPYGKIYGLYSGYRGFYRAARD